MEPPEGAELGNWESPGGISGYSPLPPWADFSSRRAPLAEITWNKQRRFLRDAIQTAAPTSAGCMSMPAACRIPICRGFSPAARIPHIAAALLPTKTWHAGRTGGSSRMANGMPY